MPTVSHQLDRYPIATRPYTSGLGREQVYGRSYRLITLYRTANSTTNCQLSQLSNLK